MGREFATKSFVLFFLSVCSTLRPGRISSFLMNRVSSFIYLSLNTEELKKCEKCTHTHTPLRATEATIVPLTNADVLN